MTQNFPPMGLPTGRRRCLHSILVGDTPWPKTICAESQLKGLASSGAGSTFTLTTVPHTIPAWSNSQSTSRGTRTHFFASSFTEAITGKWATLKQASYG